MSFKQIEKVFAARFAVKDDKALGFRARLQHLQRQGIPSNVNTGKGKPATYGWKQIIQLMVTLDLIDLGITPEIAVRRVKQNTDQILAGIRRVVGRFETNRKLINAIERGYCSIGKVEYVVTSAAVLSFDESDSSGYLIVVNRERFFRSFTDDTAVDPMSAFINIGTRMMLVANLVGAQLGIAPKETAEDLKNWLENWANEDTLS
jgi:hypothetical protein